MGRLHAQRRLKFAGAPGDIVEGKLSFTEAAKQRNQVVDLIGGKISMQLVLDFRNEIVN